MAGSSRMVTGFLKRVKGHPFGEIFPLTVLDNTVGRSPQCEICIPDSNISRKHCSLNYGQQGWTITDFGGVNGTYLEGEKLSSKVPVPLKDGMFIMLGHPEDAPCGFVFLSNCLVPTNRNGDSLQPKKQTSTTLNMNISFSLKREGNPCTDCVGIKHIKTKLSTSRQQSNSREVIASVSNLDSSEPTPGPYIPDKQHRLEDDSMSDCSISSMDSLKTRIRKKQKRNSLNSTYTSNHNNAAVPMIESSPISMESDELTNIPCSSTSPVCPLPDVTEKLTILKASGPGNSLFDKVWGSRPSTQQDTDDSENSESLLEKSSQPVENGTSQVVEQGKKTIKMEGGNKNTAPSAAKVQNTIVALHEKVLKLQKCLSDAHADLKKMNEKNEKMSNLIEVLKNSKGISPELLFQVLEDELSCNICTEILIKATTLNCAHTFCAHCISIWKKKKKQCPMCRERIESETGIIVLDNLINKAVEHLDESYQKKRLELQLSREEDAKNIGNKKKKPRKGRRRNTSIQIQTIQNNFPDTSTSNPAQQSLQFHDFRQLEMAPLDIISIDSLSERTYPQDIEIQLSDGSETSVEGNGYYGGFGRCYNCGRRGHWANGCPG